MSRNLRALLLAIVLIAVLLLLWTMCDAPETERPRESDAAQPDADPESPREIEREPAPAETPADPSPVPPEPEVEPQQPVAPEPAQTAPEEPAEETSLLELLDLDLPLHAALAIREATLSALCGPLPAIDRRLAIVEQLRGSEYKGTVAENVRQARAESPSFFWNVQQAETQSDIALAQRQAILDGLAASDFLADQLADAYCFVIGGHTDPQVCELLERRRQHMIRGAASDALAARLIAGYVKPITAEQRSLALWYPSANQAARIWCDDIELRTVLTVLRDTEYSEIRFRLYDPMLLPCHASGQVQVIRAERDPLAVPHLEALLAACEALDEENATDRTESVALECRLAIQRLYGGSAGLESMADIIEQANAEGIRHHELTIVLQRASRVIGEYARSVAADQRVEDIADMVPWLVTSLPLDREGVSTSGLIAWYASNLFGREPPPSIDDLQRVLDLHRDSRSTNERALYIRIICEICRTVDGDRAAAMQMVDATLVAPFPDFLPGTTQMRASDWASWAALSLVALDHDAAVEPLCRMLRTPVYGETQRAISGIARSVCGDYGYNHAQNREPPRRLLDTVLRPEVSEILHWSVWDEVIGLAIALEATDTIPTFEAIAETQENRSAQEALAEGLAALRQLAERE